MRKLLEHLNQVFEEGEKRKKIEKGWAENMEVEVSAREIPNETEPELYETLKYWNKAEEEGYWDIETPEGYKDLYDSQSRPSDVDWEPSVLAVKMGISSCEEVVEEMERRELRGKKALEFFNRMSKEKYSSVIIVSWQAPWDKAYWGVYIFGKPRR